MRRGSRGPSRRVAESEVAEVLELALHLVELLLRELGTVGLVVLGRHVEALEFLDVLLGDRPALEPSEAFYQRALAKRLRF